MSFADLPPDATPTDPAEGPRLSAMPGIDSALMAGAADALGLPPMPLGLARQAKAPLTMAFVRELTAEDLDVPSAGRGERTLTTIRAQHHQIARLLAQGRDPIDVSLVTGYTPGAIYELRQNEMFQELIAHYAQVESMAEADVQAQMRGVGIEALALLRERQEANPDAFSIGQLQDQVKLLLVEPMKAKATAQGAAPPAIAVGVTFVQSPVPQAGDVIDAEIVGERRK